MLAGRGEKVRQTEPRLDVIRLRPQRHPELGGGGGEVTGAEVDPSKGVAEGCVLWFRGDGFLGESPGFSDACLARDAIGFRCVRKAL